MINKTHIPSVGDFSESELEYGDGGGTFYGDSDSFGYMYGNEIPDRVNHIDCGISIGDCYPDGRGDG